MAYLYLTLKEWVRLFLANFFSNTLVAKRLIVFVIIGWSLLCMQYTPCICNNLKSSHWCSCNTLISFVVSFIMKCNTFVFYNLSNYLDLFFLNLLCFVGLGANVLHGLPRKAWLERKMGIGFCKVETCNALYSTKYLHWKHGLSMELGKPKCPSIGKRGGIVKTMHWWMHRS